MAAYDAFVSYSHARDKPIAAALQSVIQTLGKPWYRRRALRVFRDDTSLSATPSLWPSIETALGNSRFLILLASVGDVKDLLGDRAAALADYEESLAIIRKLAASDPSNASWQHDVSISLERIGNIRLADRDPPARSPSTRRAWRSCASSWRPTRRTCGCSATCP